jgi:hypothetical protein
LGANRVYPGQALVSFRINPTVFDVLIDVDGVVVFVVGDVPEEVGVVGVETVVLDVAVEVVGLVIVVDGSTGEEVCNDPGFALCDRVLAVQPDNTASMATIAINTDRKCFFISLSPKF